MLVRTSPEEQVLRRAKLHIKIAKIASFFRTRAETERFTQIRSLVETAPKQVYLFDPMG